MASDYYSRQRRYETTMKAKSIEYHHALRVLVLGLHCYKGCPAPCYKLACMLLSSLCSSEVSLNCFH